MDFHVFYIETSSFAMEHFKYEAAFYAYRILLTLVKSGFCKRDDDDDVNVSITPPFVM